MDNINDTGISRSPLDGLNELELQLALQNPELPAALRVEIESKLAVIERENKLEDASMGENNFGQVTAKTMTKSLPQFKNNKDSYGYVDIIILMLVTWVTCLCGMFYVYSNIMG